MTESVASFDEEEERPNYEFLRSGMHCRRQITMTERKRNHNAALARDKAYVQKLLKEGKEKPEHRLAREEVIDEHWLQAAFAPVTQPEKYLPPALTGLPLTRQQVKQVTDVTSITRRSSAVAMEPNEMALEIPEIQEAFKVCSLFCALTTPGMNNAGGDPPVMSRQTFCHLACAAEGFASWNGGQPRLCRAVRHFDSLTEEVLGKTSSTATSGIVLLDCRSPAVENTPMARLFAKISQDLVKDFDKGLEFDAVAQRGRAEFQARDRIFTRLLPQAAKYAIRRQRYVNEQTSQIKHVLEKTEAKPNQLREREKMEKEREREREEKLNLQDRNRLQVGVRSPKPRSRPPSRLTTPSTPYKPDKEDPPRSAGTDKASELQEEGKDLYFNTLLQMKGEGLLGHLFEPEVLHFMAQTSHVFQTIFKAYADIPSTTGEGHMSLAALVRFGADFGLFPHKVDFQTVQWLYNTECRTANPSVDRMDSRAGSAGTSPPRRKGRKAIIKEEDGFLYQTKWLKPHLAWMSKEPSRMTEVEMRSVFILTAIDDWLESHNLKVSEIFANTHATSGTFNAQDLQLVVNFMDFEDPPTAEEIQALAGLLIVRQPLTAIDFPTLEMARVAARLTKESRSRARNCFLKDLAKMSKVESSAHLFFTELTANLEFRGLAPESFYRMLDVDHSGQVPVKVIVRQARSLEKMEPGVWTAAMTVENPFAFIGKTVEDDISREEFIDLFEEIKEARRLREASFEQKHPLFISSGTVQPPNSKDSPFAAEGFVKVIMKMGLFYLSHYGTEAQAQLSSHHKLLWLFLYMHWYFDGSRQRAEELLRQSGFERRSKSSRPSSRDSRPPSRPSSRGDAAGRRYPKHLPAMRRLLARHPTLFMGVGEVALPEWATPNRTADVVVQAAFRTLRIQESAAEGEDSWKVEGLEDDDDALGAIEEDPCSSLRGAISLEQTLLGTACHGHQLAEASSDLSE